MNEIQCDITKSTKVLIKANTPTVKLNEPLYAINWFSTRMEWLYHLYNFLALKSVLKIGGKAFFKGKITKTILDESFAERELILIVYYPSGNNFKALMEGTYFKIVSLFRMLSVKEFSFGFTQKQLSSSSTLESNLNYVIHHFKTASIDDSFFTQFETLLSANIKITYAGKMVAGLVTETINKETEYIPNLMDGVIIFESEEETDILDLIVSPEYKSLINTLDTSYIGTLKRIL